MNIVRPIFAFEFCWKCPILQKMCTAVDYGYSDTGSVIDHFSLKLSPQIVMIRRSGRIRDPIYILGARSKHSQQRNML